MIAARRKSFKASVRQKLQTRPGTSRQRFIDWHWIDSKRRWVFVGPSQTIPDKYEQKFSFKFFFFCRSFVSTNVQLTKDKPTFEPEKIWMRPDKIKSDRNFIWYLSSDCRPFRTKLDQQPVQLEFHPFGNYVSHEYTILPTIRNSRIHQISIETIQSGQEFAHSSYFANRIRRDRSGKVLYKQTTEYWYLLANTLPDNWMQFVWQLEYFYLADMSG
jgi:hypothetical protein